jgi:hypothetical protein
MNIVEIASCIKDPYSCRSEDINSMRELAERYPYAQSFSILYLKSLSLKNDVRFDEELMKHAYRISDRVKLYEIIHDSEVSLAAEVIEEESNPNLSSDDLELNSKMEHVSSEPVDVISSAPETADTKKQEVLTTSETDQPKNISEDLKEEIDVPADSNDTFKKDTEGPHTKETNLEFEVISQVVADNFITRSLNKERDLSQDTKEPVSKQKVEPEKLTDSYSSYSIEVEASPLQPKTFTSWLKTNQNESREEPKVKSNPLVDSFLREEPKIKRPTKETETIERKKAEFFSAQKKGKKSLDELSIPVSETLAKIYILQGNYPKAIYAYEQLLLSNPEKKIFFANQIEELTKKLNT